MRARPQDLNEERLLRALGEWRIRASSLEYAPVGFGDHHWIARGDAGRKWFLTVADLELKGGRDANAALRSLGGAMDTAAALRDEGHLDFVVAPLRAAGGQTVRRLGPRYALSVFPFVEGSTGDADRPWASRDRGAVLELLAALHRQAPPVSVPMLDLGLSMRGLLESALDGAVRWGSGPFAEPARTLLSRHSPAIRRRVKEFDRLVEELGRSEGAPVLTHGEPHPGNLLRREGRYLLVDWDTVGLAPPERDLWSVAQSPEDLERYAEAAGRTADAAALTLYRLRWDLEELSGYIEWFRAPHERSLDTEQAWQELLEAVGHLGEDSEAGR
jgi:spectinomycin phosphotransferase